ncbi:MAG TPA: hypothetical protein VK673_20680 [Chthoniobacterales bacterium]|nr:hypothetical protein [Chthoniobacterales bacterium]
MKQAERRSDHYRPAARHSGDCRRRHHGRAGIAAVLRLGAAATQLGTAFVGSLESAAEDGYRAALTSGAVHRSQPPSW